MAKQASRRWRGWREGQSGPAPIKGSQPTKRPGTRRRKKDKLYPWYWVKSRGGEDCGGCGESIEAGQVVGFSRPDKVLCGRCVRGRGLKITTSRKLAKERRAIVEAGLHEAAGDD